MRPALSVLFLTTLIGAGQGLFVALFGAEVVTLLRGQPLAPVAPLLVAGCAVALLLTGLGLLSSFFHLGRPERAWRAASMWRTSWLSREVIVLPLFMAAVAGYGLVHWLGRGPCLLLGTLGTLLAVALFVCTGMIYAAVKVLREWATPLTVVNFLLMGCASGFTLAAALAGVLAPALLVPYAWLAVALTVAAALARVGALVRNARLAPGSTTQTAIGVKHPRVVQTAQGAMGGSFNTREFFHGRGPEFVASMIRAFLLLAFAAPLALLLVALVRGGAGTAAVAAAGAFVVQYAGLMLERWVFFAQAQHPQNLYYQAVS